MILQNEHIVFIRNTAESWDMFENQDGIVALPKYESIMMISKQNIGNKTDIRVASHLRYDKHKIDAARWATHLGILHSFMKSNKNYLFVCEDDRVLNESDIKSIEDFGRKGGLQLLACDSKKSKAYVIDKSTAKIITENTYLFYTDLDNILEDIKKLSLIHIEYNPLLQKKEVINSSLVNLIFVFFVLFLGLGIFYILCPFNSFSTKNLICLTKMFTSKEATMS
jgi:hypothetical protein